MLENQKTFILRSSQSEGGKTKFFSAERMVNLRLVIFSLSLFSIFTYLLVVNYTNTLGIKMGQLKFKIAVLEEENRDKENLATALQAMSRIEEISNLALSMVQSETYEYLSGEAGVVAAAGGALK